MSNPTGPIKTTGFTDLNWSAVTKYDDYIHAAADPIGLVWKVQDRELSVLHFGCFIVSTSSLFDSHEVAEGTSLATDVDASKPTLAPLGLTVELHAAKSRGVVTPHPCVDVVLPNPRASQVLPTIVETIPVDVIGSLPLGTLQHHLVHVDRVNAGSVAHPSMPPGVSLTDAPVERRNVICVLDVDRGELAAELTKSQGDEKGDTIGGHLGAPIAEMYRPVGVSAPPVFSLPQFYQNPRNHAIFQGVM